MDAYQIYVNQKREDLATEEMEQANVLEIYLPKQLSEEELTKELKKYYRFLGASSISDIGRVMGKAMGLLKGKADGSLISKSPKSY